MKLLCTKLLYLQQSVNEKLNCKIAITIADGSLVIEIKPKTSKVSPVYKTYIRRISCKEIRLMTLEQDQNLDEYIIEEAKYNLGI